MAKSELTLEESDLRKPELAEVIKALQSDAHSDSSTHSSTVIYGLSDLSELELGQLASVWAGLPATYKHRILKQLVETSEAVFELDFGAFAHMNLTDKSSLVRSAAIELLWSDESVATMRQLMDLARTDGSDDVRAQAFSGLGRFVLLGEYGDIPTNDAREAQELALITVKDHRAPIEIRCRALEAIANSSHPEATALIREAYDDGNHLLKVSAIYAMGRTCDKMWRDTVLEELESSDNQIVYESVQACGALQLEESVRFIGDLISGDDREIQLMAIWALGEIGGRRAFEILCDLEETIEDREILEAVEEAVDAASFSLSMSSLDFEFDNI
ncbi:MAG: HEAT repeat domain-containing protein [Chloroflexi bacterium]|nr:HEAT repeat domain-containing protein [Chloroflexota bacterium]